MRPLFRPGVFLLTAAITTSAVTKCFGEDDDPRGFITKDGIMRECSGFGGTTMDVFGTVVLASPITCVDPVTIYVQEDLFVRSDDHIKTFNMHFVVEDGGTLTFEAKRAVLIERDEASTIPLLDIDDGADVMVNAGGWIPDHANSSTEDGGSVVNLNEGGRLYVNSNAKIAYTGNSLMAVHTSHQPNEDADGSQSVPDYGTEPEPNNPRVERVPSAQPRLFELSVDTVLTGELSTEDSLTAVWVDVDGTVMFGKRPHAPTVDASQVPFGSHKVLISPWTKKVHDVYRARAVLRDIEPDPDANNRRVFGWTKREIKMANAARENLDEVKLVLTNRGCVTVTMDGVCVLKRSGRFEWEWLNRFPWRRSKSDKYVLRATEDGLEVVRDERKVWGISVGHLS